MAKKKVPVNQQQKDAHLLFIERFLRGQPGWSVNQIADMLRLLDFRAPAAILNFMVSFPHTSLIICGGNTERKKYRLVPKFHRSQRPIHRVNRVGFVLVEDDGTGFCTALTPEQADEVFKDVLTDWDSFEFCLNDRFYHDEDFVKKKE